MSAIKPIKASKLVEILQKKIKDDGDLPVYLPMQCTAYHDEEKCGEHEVVCAGANTWIGHDDLANRIMLMDPGMVDALG